MRLVDIGRLGEARVKTTLPALILLAWPLPAGADDLDQQLERNMRVYGHAPTAPSSYGQSLAPEPAAGQAEMVVYDRMGRARSRQRVALGAPPPPKKPAEEQLTEYPRERRPNKPKYDIGYSLTAGYREDRLNWNIAAPFFAPYYGHPNVLSELKWENINVAQIKGKAEITSPKGWHFQGNVGYGFITAGKVQDSDYYGDNRTGEFSRSLNAANGGHTLDASIGAGYRFAYRDDAEQVRLSASPLVGFSYHEQNLTASNGFQVIPPYGPFPGLDSRYSTQWYGPWLGIKGTAQPFDWMELYSQFEYHWANYYAKANWNLREDFQHPVSFKHDASGEGMMTSAGLRFRFDPHWALEFNGNYTAMTTDPGTDTTYFYGGYIGTTRLNRVQWDSWGADAGVHYRY